MIFGKKKKDDNTDGAAEPKVSAKRAQDEPEQGAKVDTEQFALRIATILSKMYRMVLSVSLPNNVCQIEYGDRMVLGRELPVRMFYDAFVEHVASAMHPDDVDAFRRDFGRQALSAALSGPAGCYQGVYCVRTGTVSEEDEDSGDLSYYELRADRIPETPAECAA